RPGPSILGRWKNQAAIDAVELAMRLLAAEEDTEDSGRLPPLTPHQHHSPIRARKARIGALPRSHGDVGVHRSLPAGRSASFEGRLSRDAERIAPSRDEWKNSEDPHGVTLDDPCQTGHPLGSGREARAPEKVQGIARVGLELEDPRPPGVSREAEGQAESQERQRANHG